MAETFAERLRVAAKRVGGQTELATQSGVPKSTLAKYIAGESEPNVDRLAALVRASGVSVEWLVLGEEEPYAVADRPERYRGLQLGGEFELIPHLDIEVSAGAGRLVDQEAELSRLAFRRAWLRSRGLAPEQARLVTARGDSMEPTVSEGDTILVDTAVDGIRDDAIYVIRAGQELLQAKRLQRDYAGGVWVISDNPAYEDVHLAPDKVEQLEVIGRVVWIARNV